MTSFNPMGGWGMAPQAPAQNQAIEHLSSMIDKLLGDMLALRRRVYRSEAIEKLRGLGREPQLPMAFRSQFGEDLWLYDLFGGKTDGFFIEVGAFDGHTLSVSYAFEALGWTGLLVEPIPERAEQARARRPHSRVVNAALSCVGSAGTATFTYAPTHETLSYLVATPEHKETVRRGEAGAERQITVPLTTMNDVLGDHKGEIDFAVIDVEGGEISLLNGFDLEKYRPRVLMIEDGLYKPTSPLLNYMGKFDYVPAAHVWINRVFIRNDERALIDRAAVIST
jgi:FkbM family methyltransferase